MTDLYILTTLGENLAYWKEGAKEGMMNMGKDTFTKEELKEALKKFKANRDDVQNQDMVKNEYKYVRFNILINKRDFKLYT